MMEKTIWTEELRRYPALNKDIETEVLVIGGGMCGILCAYRLAKSGKRVVLVEAERIGSGRTRKTTAVITALQDALYSKLKKKIGTDNTRLFLEANLEAVEEYKKMAREYDFDFEEVSSYKYATKDKKILLKELDVLSELGYSARFVDALAYPFAIEGAIEFPKQGQMNPMKLIQNLIPFFEIYEDTRIRNIRNTTAFTEKHKIQAQHIIVATGYPFLKFRGFYFTKLIQNKSYVAVIPRDTGDEQGNAIGLDPADLYFRSYKDYLIIGGNDQKTGRYRQGFFPLLQHISKYYPDKEVQYLWVNQDCVSLDEMPYIGRYAKKNVYVATGFNLWGMTGSMLASMVLADRICGKENRYEKLFSPKRKMLPLPLLANLGGAIAGMLQPTVKRCGHLGCGLFWNEKEKVYECSCHGSKYDKSGKLLFNPAQKDKAYKK